MKMNKESWTEIEKEFDGFFGARWQYFLKLYDKAITGKGFDPKVLHPKNSAIQEEIKSFFHQKFDQKEKEILKYVRFGKQK